MEMKALTAEEILSAKDTEYKFVEVPEWKGGVWLRTLSAGETIEFSEASRNTKNGMIRIVRACAVVEEGDNTPLFQEKHLQVLAEKNIKVIRRLQDAALELNGFNTTKKDEAAKDEAAKNA